MKKVLIIAYVWPHRQLGGRVLGLAKYLPEFGWEPIILTSRVGEKPASRFGPPNDFTNNNRVIETYEYNPGENIGMRGRRRFNLVSIRSYNYARPFLRYIYRLYQEILDYPDEQKGWKTFAVTAGNEILQNETIDAIISSSLPVTGHLIAREVKTKHNIPWVADLRDLWSQNHNYPYGRIRKFFDKRLELKTLSNADALVTVTPPWTEKLRTLHRGKATYTITNGFDPDEVSRGQIDLTSNFTITYTGMIYTGKQDPLKVFAALRDLISDGTINPEDIDVRFYGRENEFIAKGIEEYELWDVAKQYGPVPREISFEKQRESQLLLLLNWEDQREKGVLPLKTFEYLGARRPILATGGYGEDAVEGLLEKTDAGIYCRTVEDIKRIVSELYSEFKRKGKIGYKGNIEEINRYSQREMARKFSEILDRLTGR